MYNDTLDENWSKFIKKIDEGKINEDVTTPNNPAFADLSPNDRTKLVELCKKFIAELKNMGFEVNSQHTGLIKNGQLDTIQVSCTPKVSQSRLDRGGGNERPRDKTVNNN